MDRKQHWDAKYGTKAPEQLSWHAHHLERSLRLIQSVAGPGSAIIDVGGGASTLVDDLLEAGFADVTVLDVSEKALNVARRRLKQRAEYVSWIEADVTTVELPRNSLDVWHDRALFHFLTDRADRRSYVQRAISAMRVGGHLIIGTFSLDGPNRCSGLDVVRYSPELLQEEFGPQFVLRGTETEVHRTPAGSEQEFIYCLFTKGA